MLAPAPMKTHVELMHRDRSFQMCESGRQPVTVLSFATTFIAGLILSIGAPKSALAADNGPDFTKEVRPLLSRYCFKCHGPDDQTRKSKLRLDQPEGAYQPAKSGKAAIVPKHPEESEFIKRITSTDEDSVMPPPNTKTSLSAAEKDILVRWIAAGAEYQQHWAFVPPTQKSLPPVQHTDWVQNPIDAFVLSRIEKEGLRPSERADRYTLVRRVYLDLIGLPPSPEEADAFANNHAPNAWEQLIDSLLASPRYGERWGRRWMDLARYADTNGYEKDRERSIWPWRDYVIRALNADMPFDQFTIEQIAGDLLPQPTVDQRIATGFHRNTMLNEEGGIDPLEFRFHALTDRVNTTGTAWLGLTLGCAQCHTHKYDPILQREYYQVMAFLNNADELDLDLPKPDSQEEYRRNLTKADALLRDLASHFPVEEMSWKPGKLVRASAASGENPKLLEDGSALFSGAAPDKDQYTLVVESDLPSITAIRLETLIDDALPHKGPGRVPHGNFVLTEIRITAEPLDGSSAPQDLRLQSASADVEQKDFSVSKAFDGDSGTGWAVDRDRKSLNASHTATFQLKEPVTFNTGARFVVTLDQQYGGQHLIGRPRLQFGTPVEGGQPLEVRREKLIEKRFAEWWKEKRGHCTPWMTLKPDRVQSNLPLLTIQPDNSVFVSGDITKSDTYDLDFTIKQEGVTALRLEALPDDRLPHHGPGMAYYEGPKGDFFMGEFQLTVDGKPIKVSDASHSYARNGFGSQASALLAVDGDPQTGWSTSGREGERHEAVFILEKPLPLGTHLHVKMMFGRHYACSLGRFRIATTTKSGGVMASDLPENIQSLMASSQEPLTSEMRQTIRDQFLLQAPELSESRREIERLRRPPTSPITLVMQERPPENPRQTHIHKRGEYLQPTDPVEPGILAAVAPFSKDWPKNRLGFARWLVSTNNPLTARVTVNRQWQAFFGRGLVRTTEDFGFTGEAPSHPELLDWLAVEFMKQGWSLKKLHKQIVLSATYQQSSLPRAELESRDPENRLLARGPRLRLEAEIVRDSALKVSGLLSTKMGGPSVYPPQPTGVTEVAYGSPSWPTSQGEDRYRRSVYTFAKRTAPFALFNTFDAPTGESCVARRDVSNTPLQALTLLNDVQFVEVCQAIGREMASRGDSIEDRIQLTFRRCLTRMPAAEETKLLKQFFERQRERLAQGALDAKAIAGEGASNPVDSAAWALLARAILNLDEVITKG